MRSGELLIDAGVITPAQLDEALRAQVMGGARLGTSLSRRTSTSTRCPTHSVSSSTCRRRSRVTSIAPTARSSACCSRTTPTSSRRCRCSASAGAVVVASAEPLDEHALAVIADGCLHRDKIIEVDRTRAAHPLCARARATRSCVRSASCAPPARRVLGRSRWRFDGAAKLEIPEAQSVSPERAGVEIESPRAPPLCAHDCRRSGRSRRAVRRRVR